MKLIQRSKVTIIAVSLPIFIVWIRCFELRNITDAEHLIVTYLSNMPSPVCTSLGDIYCKWGLSSMQEEFVIPQELSDNCQAGEGNPLPHPLSPLHETQQRSGIFSRFVCRHWQLLYWHMPPWPTSLLRPGWEPVLSMPWALCQISMPKRWPMQFGPWASWTTCLHSCGQHWWNPSRRHAMDWTVCRHLCCLGFLGRRICPLQWLLPQASQYILYVKLQCTLLLDWNGKQAQYLP